MTGRLNEEAVRNYYEVHHSKLSKSTKLMTTRVESKEKLEPFPTQHETPIILVPEPTPELPTPIERVHELNKRNFYLSLFNIYSGLQFSDLIGNFSKIFNDVFVQEKPLSAYKYFLTQTMIVEMKESSFDNTNF